MIISKTPFRISLIGGGTDFPTYYNHNDGLVIGGTINKYCYVTARFLPNVFNYKHRIVWSKNEVVRNNKQIIHPTVKAVFHYLKISKGLEIHYQGDLQKNSGLGTSSSFCVGLINALKNLHGSKVNKLYLAKSSIKIEQDIMNENCGSQDQIWDLLDSDEDGVSDLVEFQWNEASGLNCTNTLENERSIVDENGCGFSQLDADGDSVPNGIDICPGTPALLSVDEEGCSISQKQETSSSSSGPPAFVIASIFVVLVLAIGAGVAVFAQNSKKSKKKKKKRSKSVPSQAAAPAVGEYSEQAAQALAPEPTPLPELSGNTVDEDGIEWAQDAAGNWYWREENGQFELYES